MKRIMKVGLAAKNSDEIRDIQMCSFTNNKWILVKSEGICLFNSKRKIILEKKVWKTNLKNIFQLDTIT